jgi:Predicted membrane protein (DUF2339)
MTDLIIIIILWVLAAAGSRDWALFVTFAAMGLVTWRRFRTEQKKEEQIANLTRRLSALEFDYQQLRKVSLGREPEAASEPARPVVSPRPAPAPAEEEVAANWVRVTHSDLAPARQPATPPPAAPPRQPAAPPPAPPPPIPARPSPAFGSITQASAPAAATARATAPTRATAPAAPAPPRRSSFDIEELLGTNWLPKMGIILVVLGMYGFLALVWGDLPAAVKILIGYLSAGLLLGGGIGVEKSKRYQILGQVGIGGGWAVAFGTTYFMHYSDTARLVQSETLGLILLLAVTVAMVAHTLKYKSQLITGLGFLLAFSTVTIGHTNTVYSLAASALLAAGLVVLVRKFQWFELEVFGILASYLNHFYWLYFVMGRAGGRHHAFPEFWPSTLMLVFYWAVFRGSYILRTAPRPGQENISTLAALLNSFGLLALLKYQSQHPEWAFWALLVIGGVELILAQLPIVRQRRTAFVILSTIGATLVVAAFPFRYAENPQRLSVLWLMAAEAFFLAGVFSREVLFRRFGLIVSVLTAAQALMTSSSRAEDYLHRGMIFALGAVLFYLNALVVPARWPALLREQFERDSLRALSYLAALMAFVAIWVGVPNSLWISVAWAGAALFLSASGLRRRSWDLFYQSYFFGVAALMRALTANFEVAPAIASSWTGRILPVSLIAACFYGCAVLNKLTRDSKVSAARVLYNCAATLLVTVLAWYEIQSNWLAVGWMVFALMLAAVARRWRLPEFLYQSGAVGIAAMGWTLGRNLLLSQPGHHDALRLKTVGLVIAGFYGLAGLSRIRDWAEAQFVARGHLWLAATLAVTLCWYELIPISVVVAWAILAVVFFEVGMAVSSTHLRLQAYVLLVASFIRIFFANLNAPYIPGQLSPRIYTVLPLVAVMFYVYFRLQPVSATKESALRIKNLVAYLGTAAVLFLLRFELSDLTPEWVILAWAALAAVLVGTAMVLKQRLFLHQAIMVSLALLGRGLLYNMFEEGLASNFWHGRVFSVGCTVLVMFLTLPMVLAMRDRTYQGRFRLFNKYPEQFFFFVPLLLLTVLLERQLHQADSGMLTIAWGIEAVAVFLLALWIGIRSFRLAGLGLLLLCVGKIATVDLVRMSARDRWLTAIVLGCALLLVSYLYTRYRETLRQHL